MRRRSQPAVIASGVETNIHSRDGQKVEGTLIRTYVTVCVCECIGQGAREWNMTSSAWDAIDAALIGYDAAQFNVAGAAIQISSASDSGALLHAFDTGVGFNTRQPVASSSKIVSALILLSLVSTGHLNLTSTTRDVLGWAAPQGDISLLQLGSMVSGIDQSYRFCIYPVPNSVGQTLSLSECADAFRDRPLVSAPGTVLNYGPVCLPLSYRSHALCL